MTVRLDVWRVRPTAVGRAFVRMAGDPRPCPACPG